MSKSTMISGNSITLVSKDDSSSNTEFHQSNSNEIESKMIHNPGKERKKFRWTVEQIKILQTVVEKHEKFYVKKNWIDIANEVNLGEDYTATRFSTKWTTYVSNNEELRAKYHLCSNYTPLEISAPTSSLSSDEQPILANSTPLPLTPSHTSTSQILSLGILPGNYQAKKKEVRVKLEWTESQSKILETIVEKAAQFSGSKNWKKIAKEANLGEDYTAEKCREKWTSIHTKRGKKLKIKSSLLSSNMNSIPVPRITSPINIERNLVFQELYQTSTRFKEASDAMKRLEETDWDDF